MVMYLEALEDAFKDLEVASNQVVEQEKDFADSLREREKTLYELDGIDMTDEEIDDIVNVQLENSPNRMRVNDSITKIYKVMKDG